MLTSSRDIASWAPTRIAHNHADDRWLMRPSRARPMLECRGAEAHRRQHAGQEQEGESAIACDHAQDRHRCR